MPVTAAQPTAHAPLAALVRTLVLIVLTLGGSGCESEADRLEALLAEAGSKGRATASASLVAAWRAKSVTLDAAMTMAHDRCDNPGGPQSAAFAGAVLDAIETLDAELPHKQFNELFYYRIGGLAGQGAATAMGLGDVATARSLVLAGGTRWQNDMYWMRHPSHDALATYVLYKAGEGDEALARLRARPDLPEEVEQAQRQVQELMKADRERARAAPPPE